MQKVEMRQLTSPGFSETTYGFALTANLVDGLPGVGGLPTFPSTVEEGRDGGGYDVRVPRRLKALYLQFKIPEVLERSSRLKPVHFPQPYYRMLLRTGRPDQHQMLIEHEERGHVVFYAAPRFHCGHDLNTHFRARRVLHHSAFFRPSDIGPLDEEPHHVAYHDRDRRDWWVFSEPSPRYADISGSTFVETLQASLQEAAPRPLSTFAEELLESLNSLENKQEAPALFVEGTGEDDLTKRTWQLIRRAGDLSQTVLGAHLFVIWAEGGRDRVG